MRKMKGPKTMFWKDYRHLSGQVPLVGMYGYAVARQAYTQNYPSRLRMNIRSPHIKNRILSNIKRKVEFGLNDFQGAHNFMASRVPYKEYRYFGNGIRNLYLYYNLNGYNGLHKRNQARKYMALNVYPRILPARPYNMALRNL